MKNRFFTVLILRHAGDKFRKLRVSYPFVITATLAAGAVVLAGLYAPRLIVQLREREIAIDHLAHENAQLHAERETFESALASVNAELGRVEAQADRLAEELGVEAPANAAGGPAEAGGRQRYWFEADFRGLRSRTDGLSSITGRLDDAFRERLSQLAATPSLIPVEGWFSHGYGWRKDPFTGERDFHHGIDIVAPEGSQIRAPADGVIARSGRFPQLGRSIDIAHGYGYVTRYAHLNEIGVQSGDRVRRGDVIGLVGSSGRSTGPHLHYEVFRDGRRINPWKYLGQEGD